MDLRGDEGMTNLSAELILLLITPFPARSQPRHA